MILKHEKKKNKQTDKQTTNKNKTTHGIQQKK